MTLTPDDDAAETRRLKRIAAHAQDADVLCVECVYGHQVVRFEISSLELQHVSPADLWTRYGQPAFTTLSLPRPVTADSATDEASLVGVVGHSSL